jgi:hypothetical protein
MSLLITAYFTVSPVHIPGSPYMGHQRQLLLALPLSPNLLFADIKSNISFHSLSLWFSDIKQEWKRKRK